jgi:hypothetical protein
MVSGRRNFVLKTKLQAEAIVMHFWKGSMPPCPSPDVISKNSCLNDEISTTRYHRYHSSSRIPPRRKTFHRSNAMDQIIINNRRSLPIVLFENRIVVCSWSHTTWRRLFCLSVSWHSGCSSVRLVDDWVRLIGSLSYWTNVGLPSALSELPKMFGLEELKKGYFPHLFNRKENQSVVLNPDAIVMHFWKGSMPPCPSPDVISKNSCLNVRQALLNMSTSERQ